MAVHIYMRQCSEPLCSSSRSVLKGAAWSLLYSRQTNLEKLQLWKIAANYDSLYNRDGQITLHAALSRAGGKIVTILVLV